MLLFLLAVCLGVVQSEILGLREGDECRPLGGGRGLCKPLNQCRDPGDFKKEHPPICTFAGKQPIICCPDALVSKTTSGQKAQLYCYGLQPICVKTKHPSGFSSQVSPGKLNGSPSSTSGTTNRFSSSSSGTPNSPTSSPSGKPNRPSFSNSGISNRSSPEGPERKYEVHYVVGGRMVEPRQHSHMALIGYGNENERQWSCGGSLINARYVLSAAHCVSPYSLGPARWARLGELDLSSNAEDAKPVDKRIVERITHPEYLDSQVYNDIALFKLDSDVIFNAWILPVCLNTKRSISEDIATVTGWGRTDFASGTSEKLLEADLNLYNETECQRLMFASKDSKTPLGYQPDKMFCAGVPDGSKDSCSGDSGGPLVIRKMGNCVKTQIGITSYGSQCGLPDSPGVYTRVSNYIAWIEDIAFGDEPLI